MPTFTNVQIARVGEFYASTGPMELTVEDFDNAVTAFESLKDTINFPIKVGHLTFDQEAAGWISNLRRDGDFLVADFVDVPDEVAKMIKEKRLRHRSVEAARNLELYGNEYAFVITAVALLGTELPAVNGLRDIAAAYIAAGIGMEQNKAYGFIKASEGNEEDIEDIFADFVAAAERAQERMKGRKGAPRLRALVATTLDQLKRVQNGGKMSKELAALFGLEEDASDAAIFEAAQKQMQQLREAAENGSENDEETEASTEAASIKAQLEKFSTELIELKTMQAKADVTQKVDAAIKAGRFIPAVRESLIETGISNSALLDKIIAASAENSVLNDKPVGSNSDQDAAELEPSETASKIAAQIGVNPETIRKSKARAAGIAYSAPKEGK